MCGSSKYPAHAFTHKRRKGLHALHIQSFLSALPQQRCDRFSHTFYFARLTDFKHHIARTPLWILQRYKMVDVCYFFFFFFALFITTQPPDRRLPIRTHQHSLPGQTHIPKQPRNKALSHTQIMLQTWCHVAPWCLGNKSWGEVLVQSVVLLAAGPHAVWGPVGEVGARPGPPQGRTPRLLHPEDARAYSSRRSMGQGCALPGISLARAPPGRNLRASRRSLF